MKDLRHEHPSTPQNNIPEAVTMRNNSVALAGPRQRKAKCGVTEDAARFNVEKDLYDLLDVCLKMLELEKKRKNLSGSPALRELDVQMAAMMKNRDIFVSRIVSGTRKRLRHTERARP